MNSQKDRLLVIGGNGFIGEYIVNYAIDIGWDVTSISLQSSCKKACDPKLRFIVVDIRDGYKLSDLLKSSSFEYVVNCGGYIDHTLFSNGGVQVFDAHFVGVVNLARILDRKVLRAFVNIGSSDEYGNTKAPQVESQREAPISPYSVGKVAATHFLQMLYRTENFPATTLRLFLTYGPGQGNKRFLPQIIQGCLKDEVFPVSEGQQVRDFCFIEDVVSAVFLALTNTAARGEVFNIASGQPVTVKYVINMVNKLIGKGEPQFGKIPYRPYENKELYGNISKAKGVLCWKPKTSLEVGLEKTIKWNEMQLDKM